MDQKMYLKLHLVSIDIILSCIFCDIYICIFIFGVFICLLGFDWLKTYADTIALSLLYLDGYVWFCQLWGGESGELEVWARVLSRDSIAYDQQKFW